MKIIYRIVAKQSYANKMYTIANFLKLCADNNVIGLN